jgi:hypothetical protein
MRAQKRESGAAPNAARADKDEAAKFPQCHPPMSESILFLLTDGGRGGWCRRRFASPREQKLKKQEIIYFARAEGKWET